MSPSKTQSQRHGTDSRSLRGRKLSVITVEIKGVNNFCPEDAFILLLYSHPHTSAQFFVFDSDIPIGLKRN